MIYALKLAPVAYLKAVTIPTFNSFNIRTARCEPRKACFLL